MPDNKVDSILLEIGATTDKADGGIDKVTKALTSMKKITEGIDTEKLKQMVGAMKGFSGMGEELKNAGAGMRGIASSIKSLSGVDTAKLNEVAAVVKEVGTALGNLGSNNKVSIRIDSEGAQRSVKPLEGGQQAATATQSVATAAGQAQAAMDGAAASASRLAQEENQLGTAGQSAASGQSVLNNNLNQTNTNTANARIQKLIDSINKYKETIRSMESGKKKFDTKQYEEAVNGLRKAQEQFKEFKETVSESPKNMDDIANSIKSIGDAAQKCGLGTFASFLQNIAAILPSIEIGGMAANAGFQQMAVGLQAVQAAIPIIGIILTLITTIINVVNQVATSVKNAVQKVIATIKTVVNKIRAGITAIINKFKELKKRVREAFGFSEKKSGEFAKKLGSIIRLGTFMLLRSMFTHLFELVKNGFDNLVVYSKRIGSEFHKNVNLLYNDIRQLGASIATAFEPILNVVTPILDYLIQKLIAATNALAQFFSALTGKKFYTKAIKQNKDYADSLDSAAKAAKNLTTGIDELNILNDDKGGGSGNDDVDGSGFEEEEIAGKYKDLADMIKKAWEEADFYDIGRMFGEKLKEALENIPWDGIKKTLRKIAKCIATFLNGFLETPGLFTVIGQTIAQGINSAFEFVDSFVENFHWVSLGTAITDAIKGALETLDWPLIYKSLRGIGKGIADFLSTMFKDKKTWELVGTSFSNAINSIIWGAQEFVTNFDFSAFGTAVASGIGNALTGISWVGIGYTLSTGINGAFQALLSFAETFPWTELALKIAMGVNSALGNLDWTTIKSGVTTFAKGLGSNLNTAITQIDWAAVGKTIGECINTIFSGAKSFLNQIDFKKIGSNIATAINKAVKTIDWKNAGGTINSLITGVCTLINTLIDEVDWFALMGGVTQAMAEIDWDTLLATVFRVFAAKWTFKKIFKTVSFTTIGISIVGGIKDGIDKAFSTIGTWIYDHLTKPWFDKIKEAFGIKGEKSEKMDSVGRNCISGFLQGITTAWLPTPLKIWKLFGDLVALIKEKLGIHSPSTVFDGIGKNVVSGFINGIAGKFTDCKNKILEWADKVRDWFSGTSFGKICKTTWETYGQNIITGFKDKIGNTYTTVKDNVTTWASKVKEWFNGSSGGGVNSTTWTSYANEIITGFKTKIGNSYTQTKDNISTWASKVHEWYTGSGFGKVNSSSWQTYANNIITGFKDKIGNTYTTTKDNITTWASSVRDWFSGTSFGNINNGTWTSYAGNIITGFKNKISGSYTETKDGITTWASNLKTWFTDNGYGGINNGKWNTYAGNIITGFKNKIGSSYTECKSNMETWASNVKTWFTNTCSYSKWYDIASDVVSGFKNGIGNLYTTCKNNIESWGSSIIEWFKDKLDINSPSRVFKQLGAYSVEGYNLGVEKEGAKTKGIVTSWANSFTDMDISLGTRLKINDSTLRDYQNNYGTEFTNEAIVQRVTKEVSTKGAIQTTLNSSGGLREAIKEALDDLGITSAVNEISKNTKTQADKKEQTIVEIGGKTITDAVTTQRSANGYSFQGA